MRSRIHFALVSFLVTSFFISFSSLLVKADPVPPPSNPSLARQEGQSDGYSDGSREGQVRGPTEGQQAGKKEGYSAGFNQCEREEKERQYNRGLQEGYVQGEYEGQTDGNRQGQFDGERDGIRDGKRDGENRADQDAQRDATPPGRAKGIEQANQSDATTRGFADGLIAGDQEARAKALSFDYPRGRQTYRDEKYAEAIESEDEFSQREFLKHFSTEKFPLEILDHQESRSHFATPDYRYYNPHRTYPNADENQAYQDGYRNGYSQGFNANYGSAFDSSYNLAYRQYWDQGCRDAKNQNYFFEYQRGFQDGKRQGYSATYQRAYDQAYRPVYDRFFRQTSDQSYRDTYPSAYDRHFELARASAYSERYQALYNEAHERGRVQKYNEVYPRYAEQEYQRGRVDEADDFQRRPARLIKAEVVESIPNGLYEPGETLRFRVQLRNFSENSLNGRDIRVQLQALDPGSAIITEAEATLVKDLRRKSKTTIHKLLEFRLNEAVVKQSSRFILQIFYQGKNIAVETFDLTAQYMMQLRFARPPELSEGIPTQVAFKIKNQASVSTDAGFKLRLKSDPEMIELVNPEISVGIINPGEERTVSFKVIARKPTSTLYLPLALEAVDGSGRRIGLFDETHQVPVLNDYKIGLQTDTSGLRKPGLIRADYSIRNINSRFILKGLQLLVRIKSNDREAFAVLGPNPQYLNPIIKNQTLSFLVPILVKSENSGGIVELEVQEDGRTVVIHQAKF